MQKFPQLKLTVVLYGTRREDFRVLLGLVTKKLKKKGFCSLEEIQVEEGRGYAASMNDETFFQFPPSR